MPPAGFEPATHGLGNCCSLCERRHLSCGSKESEVIVESPVHAPYTPMALCRWTNNVRPCSNTDFVRREAHRDQPSASGGASSTEVVVVVSYAELSRDVDRHVRARLRVCLLSSLNGPAALDGDGSSHVMSPRWPRSTRFANFGVMPTGLHGAVWARLRSTAGRRRRACRPSTDISLRRLGADRPEAVVLLNAISGGLARRHIRLMRSGRGRSGHTTRCGRSRGQMKAR